MASLEPLQFEHLLDLGGGPGTWTIAFLRAVPQARATLYDLPEVSPMARRHIEAAGLGGQVRFVPGDPATVDSGSMQVASASRKGIAPVPPRERGCWPRCPRPR